jgi:hypothetical protein
MDEVKRILYIDVGVLVRELVASWPLRSSSCARARCRREGVEAVHVTIPFAPSKRKEIPSHAVGHVG